LAPFRHLAVDASFDLERGADPADSFQHQGRDHCRLFALWFAACILRQISHHEERSLRMAQHAGSRIGFVSRLGSQSLP
jgi:hypothetical protein